MHSEFAFLFPAKTKKIRAKPTEAKARIGASVLINFRHPGVIVGRQENGWWIMESTEEEFAGRRVASARNGFKVI